MAESRSNGRKQRTAAEIAGLARAQAEELLGKPAESVSGVARDGDGWTVTLELLELERIPPTTSLLGSYEVKVDGDGELLGVRRTRRYARNQSDPQEQVDR